MSVAEILDDLEYGPAPESDAEARAWLGAPQEGDAALHRRDFRKPKPAASSTTIDPATGDVLAQVAEAGEDDIDDAVDGARERVPEVGGAARP